MFGFKVSACLLLVSWLVVHCVHADNYDATEIEDSAPATIMPLDILEAIGFPIHPGHDNARLDGPGDDDGTEDGGELHYEQDGGEIDHTQDSDELDPEEDDDVDFWPTARGKGDYNIEASVSGKPTGNDIDTTVYRVTTEVSLNAIEPDTQTFYTKENITADSDHLSSCTAFCQEIGVNGECVDDAICFFKTLVSLADPGRISENMELWSTINTPDDVHQIVQEKGIKKLVEIEKIYVDDLAEVITRTYEQLIVNERQREKAGNKSGKCCTGICERFDQNEAVCELKLDCFFKTFLHIVETDVNRHLLDLANLPSYQSGYLFVEEFFRRLKLEKDRLDSFGNSIIAAYDKMVDIIRENILQYGQYQHLLKYDQPLLTEKPSIDQVSSHSSICRAVCAVADNNGDCALDVECLMRQVDYHNTQVRTG